jgi:hypothetical protein
MKAHQLEGCSLPVVSDFGCSSPEDGCSSPSDGCSACSVSSDVFLFPHDVVAVANKKLKANTKTINDFNLFLKFIISTDFWWLE